MSGERRTPHVEAHTKAMEAAAAANRASHELRTMSGKRRTSIINAMADGLEAHADVILEQNAKDIAEAEQNGVGSNRIDVLRLSINRLGAITKSVRAIAALKDPIGASISRWIRPNGLEIVKIRSPLGVIVMTYEFRAYVTANMLAACVKACNGLMLCGPELSSHTDTAVIGAMISGGGKKGLPENSVFYTLDARRTLASELVRLEGKVDLLVPRGDDESVRWALSNARIPAIKALTVGCHIYVDESADPEMALGIIEASRVCRPGECAMVDTVVIHRSLTDSLLPQIVERLARLGQGVADDVAAAGTTAEAGGPPISAETTVAIRVVDDMAEAVRHINQHGARLAEVIVTSQPERARLFEKAVDAAVVYTNASTRFTCATEFGMGADIGISTDKLHARGPMGLEDLTTYSYAVRGKGQTE